MDLKRGGGEKEKTEKASNFEGFPRAQHMPGCPRGYVMVDPDRLIACRREGGMALPVNLYEVFPRWMPLRYAVAGMPLPDAVAGMPDGGEEDLAEAEDRRSLKNKGIGKLITTFTG